MIRHRLLARLAGLLLLALPAGALAATGTARFNVSPPKGPGTKSAHLEFWLAPGYRQLIGALAGTPAIGHFRRQVQQGSRRGCVDDLQAFGRAQHTAPVRYGNRVQVIRGHEPHPGSVSKYLRVVRSGHTGAMRWYVGPTWSWPRTSPDPKSTDLTALAIFRAPSRFASAKRPWAVVTLDLNSAYLPAGPQTFRDGCHRGEATLIRELARAIRTTRLLPGRATAAPGVPTATA